MQIASDLKLELEVETIRDKSEWTQQHELLQQQSTSELQGSCNI